MSVKPLVNPEGNIEDQAMRLLGLHFGDMTQEFKQTITSLYIFLFVLKHQAMYYTNFAGFGRQAYALSTRALAFLAGYDENSPPFMVKFEAGWVSLQWKDGNEPPQ